MKQAGSGAINLIRQPQFQNRYVVWTAASNAPSELFPPAPSALGCLLATDFSKGHLSACAIAIRACNHDGTLHINEDLFWFRDDSNGNIVREHVYSQFHRHPTAGSYTGALDWESVRRQFGIPGGSQGDVNTFLRNRSNSG